MFNIFVRKLFKKDVRLPPIVNINVVVVYNNNNVFINFNKLWISEPLLN